MQAGPPWTWLAIEWALAVVGLAVAVLGSRVLGLALAGWLLSGPLAILAASTFTVRDTQARTRPFYGERDLARYLHIGGLVVAAAGIVVASLGIAGWAGRI